MSGNLNRRKSCGANQKDTDDRTTVSEDTRKYDILSPNEIHERETSRQLPGKSVAKMLEDAAFGRKDFCFQKIEPIKTFHSLTLADLISLMAMVVLEFEESLDKEWRVALDLESSNDLPQDHGVFLVGNDFDKDLAVCLPDSQGDHRWIFRDDPVHPITFTKLLVSLGSFARIMENLRVTPILALMKDAMKRENFVDVVDREDLPLNMNNGISLNRPQKMAVATVASPSFTKGFLAIQGPPGTGENCWVT